ncbi:MAG: DUF4253 domain-containing protein [Streptomyces sp.]|nr:DUF4253 domain-containing protein [Streptomyces sp.]
MTEDVVARLAEHGVDVPGGARPAALGGGVTAWCFPSQGEQALGWWERVRALHPVTGIWPVLLPAPSFGGIRQADRGTGPAERLAAGLALDAEALLNPKGGFGELDDRAVEAMLAEWPGGEAGGEFDEEDEDYGPERIDRTVLTHVRGAPAPAQVALIEAGEGWQVPTLLDFGGWNQCPEPPAHAPVLRRWYERYGAEVVWVSHDALLLAMTRPPVTRRQALAFAWEYPSYCLDGMDAYGADDIPDLASCLIDAEVVRFWWD